MLILQTWISTQQIKNEKRNKQTTEHVCIYLSECLYDSYFFPYLKGKWTNEKVSKEYFSFTFEIFK